MQRSNTEDEKLQMFFDGELAPEEEIAVRRDLEGSPEAMAQLREWKQLREGMKSISADWSKKVDSEALFGRIQAQIGSPTREVEPSKRDRPELRVVPGRRERRIWGGVATGFAAAAVIFLAVMAWPKSRPGPTDLAGAGTRTRGSEVLEADFGSNTGTIFEVEGGAGESLAVVWIDDEEVGRP